MVVEPDNVRKVRIVLSGHFGIRKSDVKEIGCKSMIYDYLFSNTHAFFDTVDFNLARSDKARFLLG